MNPLYSNPLLLISVYVVHMDHYLISILHLKICSKLPLSSIQHLVIHRTLPAVSTPILTPSSSSTSATSSSIPSKTPSTSAPKIVSPSPTSSTLGTSQTISRDRSPMAKSHTSQPSTTFVAKHPSLINSNPPEPPSPRLTARGTRDRATPTSSSSASSALYRDDEEKSKQVEALVYVIEGLIYGPPNEIITKSKS